MKARDRIFLIVVSLVLGFGLTLRAVQWDTFRLKQRRMEFGVNLAKQITLQIETLTLIAESRKIPNPREWAIRIYSQRPDEKAKTAFKVMMVPGLPSAKIQDQEFYDEPSGSFSYTKHLVAADGTTLKIELNLGFEGFLGSQNYFTQDLFKLICFALLSFASGLVIKKGFLRTDSARAEQSPPRSLAA